MRARVPKFTCPYCGEVTVSRILETRTVDRHQASYVRRRRECVECLATFATSETLMLTFVVPKHKPRRQPTLPLGRRRYR